MGVSTNVDSSRLEGRQTEKAPPPQLAPVPFFEVGAVAAGAARFFKDSAGFDDDGGAAGMGVLAEEAGGRAGSFTATGGDGAALWETDVTRQPGDNATTGNELCHCIAMWTARDQSQ
jgi:hypothetical protein